MNIEETVSLNIRELRRSKDITQKELGNKSNISRQIIIKIENGSCQTLKNLQAIAKSLEIEFVELFKERN